ALLPAWLEGAAQSGAGLRCLVVLDDPPRPDGRGDQPAGPPGAVLTCPCVARQARDPSAGPGRGARAGRAPDLPVRRIRPGRAGRRLRRTLRARTVAARRRVLPRRLRDGAWRARPA